MDPRISLRDSEDDVRGGSENPRLIKSIGISKQRKLDMPVKKQTREERLEDLISALKSHKETYDNLIKNGSVYSARFPIFGFRISRNSGTYTNKEKSDAIGVLIQWLENNDQSNNELINKKAILLNGETYSIILDHITLGDLSALFSDEGLELINPDDFYDTREIHSGAQGTIMKGYYRDQDAVRKYPKKIKDVNDLKIEARILANISYPNCVEIWGHNSINSYNIIMEFVPYTLAQITIENRYYVSQELLHQFSKEMTGALAYLHAMGIIHMDLKPQNILVTEYFHIKIADFGLSYHPTLNQDKTPRGTPQFSAPEVLNREDFTPAADLYSLGIVVWSMCVGQFPYPNLDPFFVAAQVITNNSFRPKIPKHMDQRVSSYIQTLWHQNPENRDDAKTHFANHDTDELPVDAFKHLP